MPYWRDFVALCTESTSHKYLHYLKERHIDHIIAGQDHVDLRLALGKLHSRFGVKVVRLDAGGTLNGQLLRLGLVAERSHLIYPCLVGGVTKQQLPRSRPAGYRGSGDRPRVPDFA